MSGLVLSGELYREIRIVREHVRVERRELLKCLHAVVMEVTERSFSHPRATGS